MQHQIMQLLNTLYVTTPESYLRLENNTLRIELEDEVKLRGFAASPASHDAGVD